MDKRFSIHSPYLPVLVPTLADLKRLIEEFKNKSFFPYYDIKTGLGINIDRLTNKIVINQPGSGSCHFYTKQEINDCLNKSDWETTKEKELAVTKKPEIKELTYNIEEIYENSNY